MRLLATLLSTLLIAAAARGAAPATSADVDSPLPPANAVATFAGGCFWCMEPPFRKLPGVLSVVSGYSGGHVDQPSYEQVSRGDTGHAEAIQVIYDPARIGYAELLAVFWRNIDPTTPKRQFCDHGDQYRTAIFFHDEAQRKAAAASRDALVASGALRGAPITTEITAFTAFWPAEAYHQDYARKQALRYRIYRSQCGRDQRLQQLYGPAAGKDE